MSETNEGGLADRNAGRTGGISGAGQTGSNSSQNFGSAYGPSRSIAGRPYGITPFAVPRRDQTLQDRQFGNLGSGMVGTNFGGTGTHGGNQSTGIAGQPVPVRQRTVKRRNPQTGVVETITVPVQQPPLLQPTEQWPGEFGMPPGPKPAYAQPQFPTEPNDLPGEILPGQPQPSYNPLGSIRPNTQGNGLADPEWGNAWGALGDFRDWAANKAGSLFGGGPRATPRQFGGPVDPGQQYTVGENGPETLRMNAQGGGQVIPHNPMDRLGSMNPQMMQQMFQLMHQQKMQKMQQPQVMPPRPMPAGGNPAAPMPLQQSPMMAGPGRQDPGLPPGTVIPSRPPQPLVKKPMQGGFGLSHLGQPGVLGQLRQRIR